MHFMHVAKAWSLEVKQCILLNIIMIYERMLRLLLT
jgi:hypothetical protein